MRYVVGKNKKGGKMNEIENGERYGKLTVLNRVIGNKKRNSWNCRCACGKEVIVPANELLSGHRKSCGCSKPGLTKHPLHSVWTNMKTRCNNPKADNYRYYGGKGIRVCDEWNNSFYSFYEWAIQNGYDAENKKDSLLDRIDPNKDYCPENCRFADRYVQANNKNNNVHILFRGELLTYREIYNKYCKINYKTFLNRVHCGWDMEDAISIPTLKSGNYYKRIKNPRHS